MELLRALAVLAERPHDEHARLASLLDLPSVPTEDAWTRLFLFELFPYASVHLGPEGMLGGEARDRVAGFLRALDASPPPEPDHLPLLLSAYAELRDRADDDDGRGAHGARAMLHEHLLPWLPLYLARVQELGPDPYPSWAALVSDVLRDEAARWPEPDELSAHLRAAPGLDDPRDDETEEETGGRRGRGPGGRLVEQLLVPVRTGAVVAISDLRAAALDLGLAGRIGERRYVLEQLVGQDTPGVLRWLAEHVTGSTARALAPWRDVLPGTSDWWIDRAQATARLLRELAEEAASAEAVVPG